jgi:ADP-dependent NAD(P)H-hydrate dehydratase / NAD(P)H-hydrate epimerase
VTLILNISDSKTPKLLYQALMIRHLEKEAMAHDGVSEAQMMQQAGEDALEALIDHWPQAEKIAVVCGAGNNAGDGFVLACLAHVRGYSVTCYLTCALDDVKKGPAYEAAVLCQEAGVSMRRWSDGLTIDADVLVDALLGIGLDGAVRDEYAAIIEALNALTLPIISLDVPSGLNADTGEVMGVAIKAEKTITFIGAKLGLYTYQGPSYSGDVRVSDLGFSAAVFDSIEPVAKTIESTCVRPTLPKRQRDAHKGSYGHVLVIGGDYGMGGAVRMAAEAALRVGAGLVSVATRPEHVNVVSANRPELMCHEIRHADALGPLVEKASVIVLGPGLGQTEWAEEIFEYILPAETPIVIDADALNLLSEHPHTSDQWVITPHPGEAGRLLHMPCLEVQKNRLDAVRSLQRIYGGVAVLKGCGSLVATQSGPISLCAAGNPGMATGGMGDILSGIIGGLLAQHLSVAQAAKAGVWVHAKAADKAASIGGERGLMATDLLAHLREMVNCYDH